ncbi:NmrA family NAD(P)-binding protein [Streptomyces sp. NPDC052721]|uniref:NmrA family NAD(P)-binding protein n=1 Tax=Streptomyces sp. NPDC052721 TaxID=3154955 RepID=UPI003421EDA9
MRRTGRRSQARAVGDRPGTGGTTAIVVTGATGTAGRAIADRHLAPGQPVRALTRDPPRPASTACGTPCRSPAASSRTVPTRPTPSTSCTPPPSGRSATAGSTGRPCGRAPSPPTRSSTPHTSARARPARQRPRGRRAPAHRTRGDQRRRPGRGDRRGPRREADLRRDRPGRGGPAAVPARAAADARTTAADVHRHRRRPQEITGTVEAHRHPGPHLRPVGQGPHRRRPGVSPHRPQRLLGIRQYTLSGSVRPAFGTQGSLPVQAGTPPQAGSPDPRRGARAEEGS